MTSSEKVDVDAGDFFWMNLSREKKNILTPTVRECSHGEDECDNCAFEIDEGDFQVICDQESVVNKNNTTYISQWELELSADELSVKMTLPLNYQLRVTNLSDAQLLPKLGK